MKKKIFFAIAIVILVAVFIGYKYAYKEHRDIASETVSFTVPVEQILKEFVSNPTSANTKYADKTISVSGGITSIDVPANTIVINEKMSVIFQDTIVSTLKPQQQLNIKGRFVGYDDLLEELKMDHASIIK